MISTDSSAIKQI